ncbi:macrophage mannose receptor 1-like [Mytilus edulis]|uniref:macrophage mannose receptor 1-like n=1 Tax=Mytilus edulis TaxID=6550 RepID=UPI0039F0BE78
MEYVKLTQIKFLILYLTELVLSQKCPLYWRQNGDSCYRISYTNPKSWSDAEAWCNTQTSHLVKIEDSAERAWLLKWVKGIKQSTQSQFRFWTGLKSDVWTDGSNRDSSVSYIQYMPNSCGVLDGNVFINNNCQQMNGYICERHIGIPLKCNTDHQWQSFNNYCYKVYSNMSLPWNVAQKTCDDEGGNLFTVESMVEEGIIEDFTKALKKNFWIGIRSYNQGSSYTWLTVPSNTSLSSSLTYWTHQPSLQSFQYNATCVAVTYNSGSKTGWQPMACNILQNFICKKPEGTCQPGWVAHQNRCFQFNTQYLLSWQQADQFCQSQGGRQVSIYGKTVTNFLNSYLDELQGAGLDSFWIGATDSNTSTFTWTNGSTAIIKNWHHAEIIYKNWNSNPPLNTPNRQDCVYINTNDIKGTWRTTPDCSSQKAFICTAKFNQPVLTVTTPQPNLQCDDLWTLNSGHCFQFNDTKKSWLLARQSCKSQGGDLATVDTDSVHSFISNRIAIVHDGYWIGLNDRSQSNVYSWIQSNSQSNFLKWCPHEPLDYGRDENCVMYRYIGSSNICWNDQGCSTSLKYICQKPPKSIQFGPVATTSVVSFSVNCGPGWEERPLSQYCYSFHQDQLSWLDAREVCKNMGGDLASVHSDDEETYIKAKISPFNCIAVWLGGNDNHQEGGWQWSDGSPFNKVNWVPGAPSDKTHRENCINVYVSLKNGWNDWICNARNGFVCKKSYGSITTPTPRPTPRVPAGKYLGCPPFWKQHGRSCWLFVTKNITADAARTDCMRRGGYLATVNSQDEQNFLVANMPRPFNTSIYFKGGSIWIGISDRIVENSFVWDDGTPVMYTNWEAGEPNNWMNLNEDCGAVWLEHGGWLDMTCNTQGQGYVCKKTVKVVDTTGQSPFLQGCSNPSRGIGYGASCYAFRDSRFDQPRTWQAAQDSCKKQFGGNLATVNDRFVQAFLASFLDTRRDLFWVGLSDLQTPNTYRWIQGQNVAFTFWSNLHTGNERGTCTAMRTTHPIGAWESRPCSEINNYICESPRTGFTRPPTTLAPITPCPAGWTAFQTWCYKVYNTEKTWMIAREYCVNIGADLLSIHSEQEAVFVRDTLSGSNSHSFWIGLNDFLKKSSFRWSDNSAYDFSKWNPNEPNNSNGKEDCVQISYKYRWNDLPCFAQLQFICKISKGTRLKTTLKPQKTVTASASLCGSGNWYRFNGYCYMPGPLYGRDSAKTWYDAQNYCNANGGGLADIHSKAENDFVFSLVRVGFQEQTWLGLNELQQPGKYEWSAGQNVLDYINWASHEPNNAFGGERCVIIEAVNGYWKDDNCNNRFGFVCKKPYHGTGTITPKPLVPIKGGCSNTAFVPSPYGNKCFYVSKGLPLKTWDQALQYCATFGTGFQLAAISNDVEQAFLTSLVEGLTENVWIGFNSRKEFRHFIWQDNSQTTYTNWNGGEPNGDWRFRNDPSKGENCVEMYVKGSTAGTWNDKPCMTHRNVICEAKKVARQPTPILQGKCKSGFVSRGTSCYKFVKTPGQTWQNAASTCITEGGVLVSVNSVFENSYIESQMGPDVDYWIGLSRNKNSFSWQRSWPTLFTNWGFGEPSNAPTDTCVKATNGLWNASDCTTSTGYVCEINSAQPPLTTPAPQGHCRHSDDILWGDFCYYFSPFNYKSWPSSRYICTTRIMDLVSITSAEELNFVWNVMLNFRNRQNHHSEKNMWIGLNKGLSSGFQWVDNSAFSFSNWLPGEPSDPMNATNDECVEMLRSDGKWNDLPCTIPLAFVCKGKAVLDTQIPTLIPTQSPLIPGSVQPVTYKQGGTGTQAPIKQSGTNNKNTSGLSSGGIAAIVIVVLLLVAVGAVFGIIYWKKGNPITFLRNRSDGQVNKLYDQQEDDFQKAVDNEASVNT